MSHCTRGVVPGSFASEHEAWDQHEYLYVPCTVPTRKFGFSVRNKSMYSYSIHTPYNPSVISLLRNLDNLTYMIDELVTKIDRNFVIYGTINRYSGRE